MKLLTKINNKENPEEYMDKLVKEVINSDVILLELPKILEEYYEVMFPSIIKIKQFLAICNKTEFFTKLWSGVNSCCHDNPDGTKMIYHLESRLDRHLVLCCLQTGIYCVDNKMDENNIFIYMMTALFHDIGKPSTESINMVYNHKSYRGHGWIGQILWQKLMMHLGDKTNDFFTPEKHNLIGKGIGYHMCGLHRSKDNYVTNTLQSFLSFFPRDLKDLLYGLNHGDVLGSIKSDFNADLYNHSRISWKQKLAKDQSILEAFKDTKYWYNGIMITLQGPSGAGKSYMAKYIKNILGDRVTIIERDFIMAECINKWMQENPDKILSTLDSTVNSKNKRVALLEKLGISQEELDEVVSQSTKDLSVLTEGVGYTITYMLYKKLDYGSAVNNRMKKMTKYALLNKQIVVGDSLIYGSPDSKSVLPEEVGSVFRIAIYNTESNEVSIDLAQRRGMDVKTFTKSMRKKYGFEYISKGKNCIMEANLHTDLSFPKNIFDIESPLIRFVHSPNVFGIDQMLIDFIRELPELHDVLIQNIKKQNETNNDYILDDPHALGNFINPLIDRFDGNMDAVTEYLASLSYVLKDASLHEYKQNDIVPKTKFYLITYKEGLVNWNTYYCHATRGTVFYVKDNKIRVIKAGPPKSPEVQSLKTHQSDVSTQDSKQRLGYGHAYLQKILTGKEKDDTLKYVVSGKKDGSLAEWTTVSVNSPDYMIIAEHIINAPYPQDKGWNPGKIANMLWGLPKQLGYEYGLILSSQNTLFVGTQDMMNWYMSAAILSIDSTNASIFKNTKEEFLTTNIKEFIHNLSMFMLNIFTSNPQVENQIITVSFEAICPNRCDPVNFKEHTELACSYPTFSNNILGIRIIDGSIGKWIPHFDLQEEIKDNFKDPLFWDCSDISSINMILDLISTGRLENFDKPNNIRLFDIEEWYKLEEIDPEGFMLYSSDGKYNFNRLSSKLKDVLYYILHKLEKYDQKMAPGTKNTWQQIVLELEGWYTDRYPIVLRMQEANKLLLTGIPEIVHELNRKYNIWFHKLPLNNDGITFIEVDTKKGKKIILKRDGSIFQKPFVPLFINDISTADIITELIIEKTQGILGNNFMNEVKNAIMKNQDWLTLEDINLYDFKWKSMIEIAKLAYDRSIETFE